ncbi:MAG: FAD-dependent oxidoreductase, partial [Planctomycetes bacterium]|nr:FAD-dependent oxidoreductase [Planctomycetota bacterium]
RAWTACRQEAQVAGATRELRRFFPAMAEARVVHAICVTENRATLALTPEVDASRPGPQTRFENLELAGDWTDIGWPPTLEGACRSGRRAASLLLGDAPSSDFHDLPPGLLARGLLARAPRF